MRASTNTYSTIDSAIQASEVSLQKAMDQISSGKRVAAPSDDPLAFAQNLQIEASSANLDRYTKSANAALTQAQMADSALSTVVGALTSAISLGTEGANSTITDSQRSVLAQQVQSLLQGVVGSANTTVNGVSLFGGSSSGAEAFVADPSAQNSFLYKGNDATSTVAVGDTSQVNLNVPGDAIFQNSQGNVLGSLQQLVSALQTGDTDDIGDAVTAVSSAISHVSQVRAVYASTVDQINGQNSVLSQETVSLSTQQQNLVGADLATAATNLSQSQVANSAILAMAAKILPESLLNYLH